MNKFITLRIVDIIGLDNDEEEDSKKMGFSDDKPKKKKKRKKVKPIEGELILPIDGITDIIAIGDEVQVSTLTNSYLVMNKIDEIKKVLKIK